MNIHPALQTIQRHQIGGTARIFDTAEQFIEGVFGPQQHDAHCKPWRWHKFCQEIYGFTPDYSKRWQ